MLMLNFSLAREASPSVPTCSGGTADQSQKVAADWMVIPFSRSRSIESILAPTESLPRTWQESRVEGRRSGCQSGTSGKQHWPRTPHGFPQSCPCRREHAR